VKLLCMLCRVLYKGSTSSCYYQFSYSMFLSDYEHLSLLSLCLNGESVFRSEELRPETTCLVIFGDCSVKNSLTVSY
jgi:hypothetical protein